MHIYENLATSPFCVRKSRQSTMHAHPPHSHTATQQTKLPKQIKVCENVRVEINRILCFLNSLHFESFLTQINVAFVLDVCAQHNCWLQLRYYITKQYYIRTLCWWTLIFIMPGERKPNEHNEKPLQSGRRFVCRLSWMKEKKNVLVKQLHYSTIVGRWRPYTVFSYDMQQHCSFTVLPCFVENTSSFYNTVRHNFGHRLSYRTISENCWGILDHKIFKSYLKEFFASRIFRKNKSGRWKI